MNRAYDLIAPVLGAGIVAALVGVLVFLVLGRFFKFWAVLGYVIWELLATLGFTVADVVYHGTAATTHSTITPAQAWYARLYWANDMLVDLLRFVLVIVLIYMATEGSKRVSGRVLVGIVAVVLVLPFVIFHPNIRSIEVGSMGIPFPRTVWFQSTSELLNFGAAIMNVILWTALLRSKHRDPQVLLLSLGLGIVVTGTAVAYGVRDLSGQKEFGAVGYLFMNLTQLTGWIIWCLAFRPAPRSQRAARVPISHS